MSGIVAEVVRSGRVESCHRGYLAVVTPAGAVEAAIGDLHHRSYVRSTAKPFQAMPLLASDAVERYGFTDSELAVVIASHSGEPGHVDAVASILSKVGLDESHLQCGSHPPLHRDSAAELARQNQKPTALHNNCSGKHAGMLALSSFLGLNLDTYLEPRHPVQSRILAKIAEFSGLPEDEIGVGVDGCSAPVFYLPVLNLALMYARLADGRDPVCRRIFNLMTSFPEMIAGSGRFDTALMQATKGRVVSKVGAEGIRCVAVRGASPFGIALKIADGARRASAPVLLEALLQLELISRAELQELSQFHRPELHNFAGRWIGHVRPAFELQRPAAGR